MTTQATQDSTDDGYVDPSSPMGKAIKKIRDRYDPEAPGNDPWVRKQPWHKGDKA